MTYVKIIGGVIVLALVGWLLLTVNGWRKNAALVPGLETEVATWKDNWRIADESSKRFQANAQQLANERAHDPLPAVRLCVTPTKPRVHANPAKPSAAPETNDTRAYETDLEAGPVAGPDIGPALDDYATDAELNLIQCSELIRVVGQRH